MSSPASHFSLISSVLFRASPADMAAAARGNEPDEKNIMDGGDEWQSHP